MKSAVVLLRPAPAVVAQVVMAPKKTAAVEQVTALAAAQVLTSEHSAVVREALLLQEIAVLVAPQVFALFVLMEYHNVL